MWWWGGCTVRGVRHDVSVMGAKRRPSRWSQRGNYLPRPASPVEAPSHVAVHTRLRPSTGDEQVLWALAEETARLRGHAWSARSRYGAAFTQDDWLALFHVLREQGAPKAWAADRRNPHVHQHPLPNSDASEFGSQC